MEFPQLPGFSQKTAWLVRQLSSKMQLAPDVPKIRQMGEIVRVMMGSLPQNIARHVV